MIVFHCIHDHMNCEFRAGSLPGLFDAAAQKPGTVFVALGAVFISTLVPYPGHECIALVGRTMIKFTCIESCPVCPLGCARPQVDLFFELIPGHFPARQKIRTRQFFLGKGRGTFDVPDFRVPWEQSGRVPGACMLKLDGHLTVMSMYRICQTPESGDQAIIVHVELHSFIVSFGIIMNVLDAQRIFSSAGLHDQESYPAFCKSFVIGDHSLTYILIGIDKRCPVRCFYYPILDLHRANHTRLE